VFAPLIRTGFEINADPYTHMETQCVIENILRNKCTGPVEKLYPHTSFRVYFDTCITIRIRDVYADPGMFMPIPDLKFYILDSYQHQRI